MSINQPIALISSDYINAISIWSSLKKLQFKGRVIFLNTSGRNMVGAIWKDAEVIDFYKKDPENILPVLFSFDKETKKYFFLTNELFHPLLHENREKLAEYNVSFLVGNGDPQRILDKSRFLELIRNTTSAPVPEEYELEGEKKFPLIVKFRRSFENELHTPKPRQVDSEGALMKYVEELKIKGFSTENIQLQELLSWETSDNVSVCGWYDEKDHIFFQTRKVIQHPPKVGNGDVVEVLALDPVLEKHALEVCRSLDYKGAFEIEFIKELKGNKFKIIEMNPRFWMQHGLVEELSGHYLVAKYVGMQPLKPRKDLDFWIYPMVSIYKSLLMNFKYVPYLVKKKVYWPVTGFQAGKFLVKHFASKIS